MTREEKHKEAFKNHIRIDGLIHEIEKGGRSIELIDVRMSVSCTEDSYWLNDQNNIANALLLRADVRHLLQTYTK